MVEHSQLEFNFWKKKILLKNINFTQNYVIEWNKKTIKSIKTIKYSAECISSTFIIHWAVCTCFHYKYCHQVSSLSNNSKNKKSAIPRNRILNNHSTIFIIFSVTNLIQNRYSSKKIIWTTTQSNTTKQICSLNMSEELTDNNYHQFDRNNFISLFRFIQINFSIFSVLINQLHKSFYFIFSVNKSRRNMQQSDSRFIDFYCIYYLFFSIMVLEQSH